MGMKRGSRDIVGKKAGLRSRKEHKGRSEMSEEEGSTSACKMTNRPVKPDARPRLLYCYTYYKVYYLRFTTALLLREHR